MKVRNLTSFLAGVVVMLLCAACGSGVKGTYSDPQGAFVLDLKSGGSASFTFAGDTAPCTYKVDGNNLTLNCQGQAGTVVLTIHDDGSLTGPPGSFMPALRKTK